MDPSIKFFPFGANISSGPIAMLYPSKALFPKQPLTVPTMPSKITSRPSLCSSCIISLSVNHKCWQSNCSWRPSVAAYHCDGSFHARQDSSRHRMLAFTTNPLSHIIVALVKPHRGVKNEAALCAQASAKRHQQVGIDQYMQDPDVTKALARSHVSLAMVSLFRTLLDPDSNIEFRTHADVKKPKQPLAGFLQTYPMPKVNQSVAQRAVLSESTMVTLILSKLTMIVCLANP